MEFCTSLMANLFLAAVLVTLAHTKKVKPASAYFNICSRSEPDTFNDCVRKTIMDLKPQLIKGIPDLGLVPLEPLIIPRMELVQGGGSFGINTTLVNLTIRGLGEYSVQSANIKIDNDIFASDIVLTSPDLRMTAKYAINGQILVLPIKGEGDCELNFTDVSTVGHARGRVVNRNGVDFVDIQSLKWDISVNGKASSWFYNLYNGNKQLSDGTNRFLNDNSKEAFKAYKHLPEEAFGEVFKDLTKRVFDTFPLKELLP